MNRTLVTALLAGLLPLALPSGNAQAGFILNSDFSQAGTGSNPFADWSTTYGAMPLDGGGFAVFEEASPSSFSLVELEQTFLLPAGASRITFHFLMTSPPPGISGTPVDSF